MFTNNEKSKPAKTKSTSSKQNHQICIIYEGLLNKIIYMTKITEESIEFKYVLLHIIVLCITCFVVIRWLFRVRQILKILCHLCKSVIKRELFSCLTVKFLKISLEWLLGPYLTSVNSKAYVYFNISFEKWNKAL